MDAITLLHNAAATYRDLRTLTIEATLIHESGDENANNRSEQRARFWYAAPRQMRFETGGLPGTLQVADGTELHDCHLFPHMPGGSRYTSHSLSKRDPLPHVFNPQIGVVNDAFLYPDIDQYVVASEVLREEDGCFVVSVKYPSSPHRPLVNGEKGTLFWIDPATYVVMRAHGKLGHRWPGREEVSWTTHTMVVRNVSLNQPIPVETFRFVPPPGSQLEDHTGGGVGFVSGGSGSGFSTRGRDQKKQLEFNGWHEWEGDILVEHGKWKMRGIELALERRFTFSEDEKELTVTEKITGPKGAAEMSCRLPVA